MLDISIFQMKSLYQAAERAKESNLKPIIINNHKSYYYTTKDLIDEKSSIALQIGGIIELRAITKAGINQMHNIIKQFNVNTIHYKGKNSEHLLFNSCDSLANLPFDQLRLKCLNRQHGVFLNIKNALAIIPPTPGYKIIRCERLDDIPADFISTFLDLQIIDVVRGEYSV